MCLWVKLFLLHVSLISPSSAYSPKDATFVMKVIIMGGSGERSGNWKTVSNRPRCTIERKSVDVERKRGEKKQREKLYWCLGQLGGLPWWPKESACNAGDLGPIPGSDRWVRKVPQGGNGNPLQDSHLENPMNRGVWWALVHRAAKRQIQLKQQHAGEPYTIPVGLEWT